MEILTSCTFLEPISDLSRNWRVLTHLEIRRIPRIAAFFDFILAEREALRSILIG